LRLFLSQGGQPSEEASGAPEIAVQSRFDELINACKEVIDKTDQQMKMTKAMEELRAKTM
jgi:hypothetical protein